jgi:hypothetical protein
MVACHPQASMCGGKSRLMTTQLPGSTPRSSTGDGLLFGAHHAGFELLGLLPQVIQRGGVPAGSACGQSHRDASDKTTKHLQ